MFNLSYGVLNQASVVIQPLMKHELFLLKLNHKLIKAFSTKISNVPTEVNNIKKISRKKPTFIVPCLTSERINNLTTIGGISILESNISWMKISMPSLTVLDWSFKILPLDFTCQQDEPVILKMAHDLKKSIPNADLYVMETFSMSGREMVKKINYLHLSSMLTVLLNGLEKDSDWTERVVFQKKFVLNNLFDLIVGSERRSARYILEDIFFKKFDVSEEKMSTEKKINLYSSVEISPKFLNFYKKSELGIQENLSIVFLLTLTFLDINVFKNENSIKKITETWGIR